MSVEEQEPTMKKRTGFAALAAALVLAGAACGGGLVPAPQASAPQAITAPSVSRALEPGRGSYADIVKVVAPAVVTIRVEGRAAVTPTGFQFPDDDFFRRFFGDRFGDE